ncbi:MAG: sugar ABC transporter substrate-binding protein [Armatimonadota bacterium]
MNSIFSPRTLFSRRSALLGLTALSFALAGCSGGTAGDNSGATLGNGGGGMQVSGETVGVALSSMNHNFFIGMRQGVEEQLAEEGMRGEFVVADDSATQQQQQVDQLIQKGVKAIVMVPVDATQAVNPVKAANAAGIPVFCIDRRVTADGAEVACTVETDNVAMGEMAAEHAMKLLCERRGLDPANAEEVKKLSATVVHLWGLEAASSAQDRAAGFERVFNSTKTPGVKIIKAVGNFNAAKSQQEIAPILTSNPDIELLFCHNDDNAIGALNAVKDVKKGRGEPNDPKRVLIVGMDGNKPVIDAVRAGEIEATVSQEPIEMGRETVKQLRKVLNGSQPDSTYIAIRHHLVTQKEAQEQQGKLWADQLKGGV